MHDLEKIWAGDLLGRRGEARFLEDLLVGTMKDRDESGIAGSFVINLDGKWGVGKTYFMSRFARQLARDHVVAEVNAWRDDHLDDPFIAIMAAIDEALQPYVTKSKKTAKLWKGVKQNATPIAAKLLTGAGRTLVKRYIGKEAVESAAELLTGKGRDDPENSDADRGVLEEAIVGGATEVAVEIESVIDKGAQKLIDQFNAHHKASEEFRHRLETALQALKKLPLFILIDELDRCRPSYAIALLERIKHLFDVSNVVFIFATNAAELKHSIQGEYGPSFDGYNYLKRFFDRTYLLSSPNIEKFVEEQFALLPSSKMRSPGPSHVEFINRCCNAYGLTPRDVKQIVLIIGSVIATWRNSFPIELALLFPLVVRFHRDGDVDWTDAEMSIPVIKLKMPVRSRGMTENADVKLKTLFSMLRGAAQSLRQAINLGEGNMSAEQRYAYLTFQPEWEATGADVSLPSQQLQLADLIGYAGKISGQLPADEEGS